MERDVTLYAPVSQQRKERCCLFTTVSPLKVVSFDEGLLNYTAQVQYGTAHCSVTLYLRLKSDIQLQTVITCCPALVSVYLYHKC